MSDWDSQGGFTGNSSDVNYDNDTVGMIQYGEIQQPGFYGNQELKNSNVAFNNATQKSYAFAGFANYLKQTKAPTNYRRTTANYVLTDAEKAVIRTKASELALIGIVPYDALEKFFYILAAIDNNNDMIYISQVIGVAELSNPNFLRNIRGIVAIHDIYKVGYLANAVASIDAQYADKYQNAQQYSNPSNSSYGNIISAITQLASFADMATRTGGNAIGGYMSELVTGTRISTAKQAHNPMLVGPSYGGKSFFGEAPVSLPAVDQMFCRRVAAFSTENGGSGTSSFQMQNFSSFGGTQSISSIVSKMVAGSADAITGNDALARNLGTLAGNVSNILNVNSNSGIEMRRSDNAIPFMIGMSAALSNETHSPFDTKIFSTGWKLGNSAGNDIQRINPQYLQVCRTVL